MTTPETPTQEQTNESAIIPSWVFIAVSIVGFLTALVVLFTTPEFNIVGWAGLAIGGIGLIVWAFMFPEDVLAILKGRALTFGGLGIGVTVILVIASVLVYNVVARQGWSNDFSERNVFSLDDQVREVLQAMGDDPSIPTVRILGFYNATAGGQRDRISVLLQDMVNNSGGKITGYTFIDPALEPLRTTEYLGEAPRIPSIVVATVDPETGEPSTSNFEVAAPDTTGLLAAGQFQIINAILSLSVEGDFRAYFLDVTGSLDITSNADSAAQGIVNDLEGEWTVTALNPLELLNPPVTLNDPLAGAEVMIIAGGTQVLSADEIAVIADYLQNGGSLIVLADISTDGTPATALDDNFETVLWEQFGVRFRDDLVIDPALPVRQFGRVYQVNNYGEHPIVEGLNPDANRLVMSSPRSIEIADTPPASVSVLVSTSERGYAKSGLDFSRDLSADELAFADGDLSGEIPLAVASENTETGARLVLFGSPDLMQNEWRAYTNIEAPEVAESAIFWASDAQNFSDIVRQLRPEPPTPDQPIFITQDQLRWMGFVVTGVIPFGMLLLGLAVRWLRRTRHSA
ncbi:MAG: Gldg family protein [Anaerolineae bacterium]